MAKRRQRLKGEKERRHAHLVNRPPAPLPLDRDVRLTDRVERLAYTRRQAAEALGVSLSTLDRRVLPAIATIQTEWGARLIPVTELERYLAERTRPAWAERMRPARAGRKPGLRPDVVARIRNQQARGESLREIARRLNADGVRTSQSGRQWWPSTVRAVLVRPSPPDAVEAGVGSA